jgi:hypothetical protein
MSIPGLPHTLEYLTAGHLMASGFWRAGTCTPPLFFTECLPRVSFWAAKAADEANSVASSSGRPNSLQTLRKEASSRAVSTKGVVQSAPGGAG